MSNPMLHYRKRPVIVEAFQMTRRHRFSYDDWPQWLLAGWQKARTDAGAVYPHEAPGNDGEIMIRTLEGVHLVSWDDWIIRGDKGELYPCKPDVFELTYEATGTTTVGNG